MSRVVVEVMLKSEILDPQGEAVANALPRLGVKGVNSVRVGKRIELDFDDSTVDIEKKAEKVADELLANPVIENFNVVVEDGDE
ncbi:phosphoribosylformylglycinamidine synthase subunit PurS [Haloglycomyces albus]|uniref:phosphoribosylformylglycinamidine synthase subunit PurS n=1 Tax=Haloglycomyces albus TaxID=526067 RepID=UPI00046CDA2D|nr:phosphoribosylformylglycinamidine synthase subunit PurS [Haloglycomyces albus]